MTDEVVGQEVTPENVTAPTDATADQTKEIDVKPEKTFTQKELDEIVQKQKAKERRKADEARKENEYWKKAALEGGRKPEVEIPDQAPSRDQFVTYEEFQKAQNDYQIKLGVAKEWQKHEEKKRAEADEAERLKAMKEFQKATEKAAIKYDDFEEVVQESVAPTTPIMNQAIIDSDSAGEIMYFLAKNPDEAERISLLPPVKQVKEIARLELKLVDAPSPKPSISKVPDPINPVGGKSVIGGSPKPEDTAAWIRAEQERMQREGKR